jgi:transcriptional regulator with XRE-family HTH domain
MIRNYLEVYVTRASGPTIARWQLGGQLRQLREAAGLTHQAIAAQLGCSSSKIYKIESGDVGAARADVLVMLTEYGVTDAQQRDGLLELQRQGKERGWWAKYGQLPAPYAMYIGLESAALAIRNFELAAVPGLLQTEAYARALLDQQQITQEEPERDRRRQVRVARQSCLTEEDPITLWAILDESVLHRQVGGAAVLRDQLRHLLEMGDRPNVHIQVLPFTEGAHPGMLGSIAILEFDPIVHSPVAYVETLAGDVYLERETDLQRVIVAYTHLQSSALSPSASRERIEAAVRALT